MSAADILQHFDQLWRSVVQGFPPAGVVVEVPTQGANLQPDALCALGRCLLRAQTLGLLVEFGGDLRNSNRLANYLARTNLFGIVGRHPPGLPLPEMDLIGRHLPMRSITSAEDVHRAVNGLVEMLLHQAECRPGVVEGFEWAINEVIDNIFVHAESGPGGIVVAQTVERPACVRVAVGDFGRGILASLREGYPDLRLGREAIMRATEQGVTRDRTVGQGNGLAGTRQIIEENGGTLVISSSDWTVQMGGTGSRLKSWSEWPFPGTQVVLTLRTNKPLDLTRTLVGQPAFPYTERMYENKTGEKLIRVADHFKSCGNRPAGKMMRTLLKNLSGPTRDGVFIDFAGVRSISSSFADEFIGKFVAEIGVEEFVSRFKVSTDTDIQRSVVNRAIQTRGAGGL